MPLFESGTPEGVRVVSVKLDGREVLSNGELLIKAANTDEGWLDVYEYTVDAQGEKHFKMTEWRPVGYFRKRREIVVKRIYGKVEVFEVFLNEPWPEQIPFDPK